MEKVKIPAEVYSRVSGYMRPVYMNGKAGTWNRGKTEEFGERRKLKVPAPEALPYRASTRKFSEKVTV